MAGLIVHEWIEPHGGAERVVEQMRATFPDSDTQALWNDAPTGFGDAYTTWLARTPLRRSKALALPFMPMTWRTIRGRREYDWILVSSHLFAHHVRLIGQANVPKFVYAHTPARYIWEPDLDQRGNTPLVRAASMALRPLDRKRAQEATAIAANSAFTRSRIERTWERDAQVIYPPVNVEGIVHGASWCDRVSGAESELLESLPETFLLGASRFVPYKQLDVVIRAGEATDLPVVLAGQGPEEQTLRARAAAARIPVTFVIRPSTPLLYALYQRALVFVFPAVEDFGIMPVEAMAAGARVAGASVGGVAESISLVRGGSVFNGHSPSELSAAIDAAAAAEKPRAERIMSEFSSNRFTGQLSDWMRSTS